MIAGTITGLNLSIILCLVIIFPILIGVYVYRDANRRGMNAPLWTLIAILAPAFVGFIVYLLVRGSYSDLKCPQCNTSVTEQFVICPKCGAKLKPSCPNCNAPVETDWQLCPNCTQPLPEQYTEIMTPKHPKDRTLIKILIAVIVIPILLIAVGIIGYPSNNGCTTLSSTVSIDTYLSDIKNKELSNWVDSVDEKTSGAYVLMSKTKTGDEVETRYLIYIPQLGENQAFSELGGSTLFDPSYTIEITSQEGKTGNTLVFASYISDRSPKLKLNFEGENIDYELTEVSYPIELPYDSESE